MQPRQLVLRAALPVILAAVVGARSAPAQSPAAVRLDPDRVLRPVPALRGVMTEWMFSADQPLPPEGNAGALREEDFALAAQIGVNTLRLAIEHKSVEDPDRPGGYREAAFQRIEQVLDWCAKYDIQVILDIHNALGREFGGDPRIWQEQEYQDRFVAVWRELVTRFKDHPQVIAYEPLNEPEPRHTPDWDERYRVWNDLAKRVTAAIREIDPDKPIIIDCIEYANPRAFEGLEATGDPNTVYSFHWYGPSRFHQQGRPWVEDKSTYHYPGVYDGERWDRGRIERAIAPALEFGDRHGTPLFCGEFGLVGDAPEMEDMLWLLDVVSLFDQHGVDWTYYHFMMRADEPYWREHWDCNLFVYDRVEDRLKRFDRKVDLLGDLLELRGEVLAHEQPADADLTVYAVRTARGPLRVYVSNKSADQAKALALDVAGDGWANEVGAWRMAVGTQGWVVAPPSRLEDGQVRLELPPQTILRLTVRQEHPFARR